MEAGKHVLVEKPLAGTVAEAEKLVHVAEDLGLVLMCDHTYCYTPAVQEIRRLVSRVRSVRSTTSIACGPISDCSSRTSMCSGTWLPTTWPSWTPSCLRVRRPVAVSALGADPLGTGQACIGYLTLHLEGGILAHSHVNWLSPTKVRTVTIGGSERMVVWDDLNVSQRLSLYDKGVDVLDSDASVSSEVHDRKVSYRYGALSAPALPATEALSNVIGEFRGLHQPATGSPDRRSGRAAQYCAFWRQPRPACARGRGRASERALRCTGDVGLDGWRAEIWRDTDETERRKSQA